jgi:murein DD-endopeptidase MepM/ murein hydrolase activator NlpD
VLFRSEFQVEVDTTPPRIDILSTAHNVALGGTGLAVFSLSEDAARVGMEIGELFFPAYPEKGTGRSTYVAYFAFPRDKAPVSGTTLMAADHAGNVSRRSLAVRALARKFSHDTIELSDRFLEAKTPEFFTADPGLGTDKVQVFLKVNRDWRERDHRRLRELAAAGGSERLWSGNFTQMKNTKTMARYAEARSYAYQGRTIDQQVHLGLDLASTAGAPVTAANNGVVAMAGDLGIYGQTVVLDHGQGIFSLYAHLSGLAVKRGQRVDKGQVLGASGQTGMAGGDHLHFAMLVSGVFVNPLEWLDQHWIDDNVNNKLSPGGAPDI